MGTDWGAPREVPQDCVFEGHCEPKRAPAKKNTKWCRGKVGISHIPIIKLGQYGGRWPCRDLKSEGRPDYILCWHISACQNCGKILDHWPDRANCPDLKTETP